MMRLLDSTLCDKVCLRLVAVPWRFPGTPLSPNNKSDLHIIIEILLKGALSAISPKSYPNFGF
jgi:hypothetical protein